jgi:monofunctional biosynthetic peptidoglycan transglycosylase
MNEDELEIAPQPVAMSAQLSPTTAAAPVLSAGLTRPAASPARKCGRWLRRLFIAAMLLLVVAPISLTAVYRFVPPPATYLMLQRLAQGYGLHKHWRPLPAIAPSLGQAVIAAEDAQFCQHHGFDFEAIQKAFAANERRPSRLRGGSTISQQTAKNVFLWPGRDYVRKGFEAYFTVLIEALWGKKRILEVYLNVVEWGPGIYGAEAAAGHYFNTTAARLTPAQSARLAAVLPSPLRWKPVQSGPYVSRRSQRIGAAAVTVREDDLAACVRR